MICVCLNGKMRDTIFIYMHFVIDKNPHMSDFVCQIKNSSELNAIYESVQRDNSGMISDNHSTPMEVGE